MDTFKNKQTDEHRYLPTSNDHKDKKTIKKVNVQKTTVWTLIKRDDSTELDRRAASKGKHKTGVHKMKQLGVNKSTKLLSNNTTR